MILVRRKPKVEIIKSESETNLLNPSYINKSDSSLISSPQSADTFLEGYEYMDTPTFKEAIKHYRTWMVVLMVINSMCLGTFTSYVFKSYGEQNIPDDAFMTTVGAVGSVLNGLCRPFWASIQDKIGYRKVYFSILIIQTICGFTIKLICTSKPLYMIWIF